MRSLKRRLTWILLGLILFSWVGSAAVTVFYTGRVLVQQVDRQLQQYAGLLGYISDVFERQLAAGLPLAEPKLDAHLRAEAAEPLVVDYGAAASGTVAPALNVWLDGRLLAVFENSPRFDPPRQPGFSFRELPRRGSHWRLYSHHDPELDLWIVVGIDLDQARWALLVSLAQVLLPLLLILPLTLLVLTLGVHRGLKPLRTLAEQIGRRSPQALDPVQVESVPGEVKPVVAALNALLERLAHALESEQRFTANAAHELTTPLAAIKAEVQLCQRQLADAEAQSMLERITVRVDRAHHTVAQLLTLARLDPEAPLATEPVDLERLLRDVLAEDAHLAGERGLRVNAGGIATARVAGNSEALAILLRNLLNNALRYARAGSEVTLQLGARGDGTVALVVANDCDALSGDEFASLTRRFYRVPGSPGAGAGLGLSIAERVANLHGARLLTGAAQGGRGFRVQVVFGSAQGGVGGANQPRLGGGD
ncbi:histidine kinase dimerization/phospho-acceptor domain-containing protein [Parahaliea mediterranea]|uniref:histidine kinase dimerization/phospho-acceptor domain-containing protein n=1 Tax=Parahaliea mediterranea TaxID=651086 RepID=UPI000E2E5703|nr:histidine kinase dimerization/phospho-acceptor domain-containing protein [Parahaliea mediterranea]